MNNGDTLLINANITFAGTEQPKASLANYTIMGTLGGAVPSQGAGTQSITLTNDGSNPMFLITGTAGGAVVIKNFKMVYSGGFPGAIDLQCCETSIRITNVLFAPTTTGDRGVRWGADWIFDTNGLVLNTQAIYGLMDHITFTAAGTILNNNCIDGVGLYQGTDLDRSNADRFGTVSGWYVEDSILDESGCSAGTPVSALIDGEHGARVTWRHNTIKDAAIELHDASTLMSWGDRLNESYSNVFTCSRMDCGFNAIQLRGGTGFHWNNTLPTGTNGYENFMSVEITRVDSTGFQDPWFTSATNGTCTGNGSGGFVCGQPKFCSDLEPHCDGVGGTSSGQICGQNGETIGHPGVTGGACPAASCLPNAAGCGACQSNPTGTVGTQSFCGAGNVVLDHIDGTDTTGGYPAINQVGRGAYNSANNPVTSLRPYYVWNNTNQSSVQQNAFPPLGPTGHEEQFVVNNRDLFMGIDSTNCAAGAANCIGGVGQGTLANRPTGCSNTAAPAQNTYPGPGYFATNAGSQGTLYVCMNDNTTFANCTAAGASGNFWCPYYVPLVYPHPLQATGVPSGKAYKQHKLQATEEIQ